VRTQYFHNVASEINDQLQVSGLTAVEIIDWHCPLISNEAI
jgi:hypothetical protein